MRKQYVEAASCNTLRKLWVFQEIMQHQFRGTSSLYIQYELAKSSKEGITRTITLRDDDPRMVTKMLRYIYTHDYEDDHSYESPFITHAYVYAMGDKYEIETLKELAKARFEAYLFQNSKSLATNIADFLVAIQMIYTTTLSPDRGLRDPVIAIIREQKYALREIEEFMDLFRSDLAGGEFAVDVLDAWTQLRESPRHKFMCNHSICDARWFGHHSQCPGCGNKGFMIDL